MGQVDISHYELLLFIIIILTNYLFELIIEESGSVRLHPDYDNKTATWTFHFNLLIPKRVGSSSVVFYDIAIHLIDHDTRTWNFYRNSTQRYLVSKHFNQTDQDQRV